MFREITGELIVDGDSYKLRTPDEKIRKLYWFGSQFHGLYVRFKGEKYEVNISDDGKVGSFCLEYPILL